MHLPIETRWLPTCALVLAVVGLCAPVADAARRQPEDPFADELNPFGTGRAAAPAPTQPPPQRPATRPAPKLPVPFPETTVPGEPADRRERSPARGQRPPFPGPKPDVRGEDADLPRRERMPGFDGPRAPAPAEPTAAEKKLAEADRFERAGKLDEARDTLREVVRL
ncbi:MAG: hypothetical protein EBX36_10950, partial [Planctomycetia bacterium]|nr:hypothetical protein [Planctomycetia bacterium]